MIRSISALALAGAMIANAPAMAQEAPQKPLTAQAVGVDVFAASDADHTEVSKLGVNLDWRRAAPDRYDGLRVEAVRFKPRGQDTGQDLRVYYRFADRAHDWTWNGRIGTDGDTAVGAFDIHNDARFRQEYFAERDIVETTQGLEHGIYYTFAGGAIDVPIDDRNNLNVLGAVQDFTGRNIRLHLRGKYVHVLSSEWGLTAQVRTRYFFSSIPGEFDYFSPRWYAEVMPVLQLRRYQAGWRYALAAGVGARGQSTANWRQARLFSAEVTSPPVNGSWALVAAFHYSNTPNDAEDAYEYRQLALGVTRSF